jgi:hypothetical protein
MTETVQSLAVNNTLRFLQPNDAFLPGYTLAVRIERDSDGYVYDAGASDPAGRVFKPDLSCEKPFVFLLPGTGRNAGRLEASLTINSNFSDGDYIVNYHDMRQPNNIFAMDKIQVFGESVASVKPLKDIDLCYRLMRIQIAQHKEPNSLGALLNELLTRIKAIQTKLGA